MTVFEFSNETLKEFYVCVSSLPLDDMMRECCARPPRVIAHWRKDQGIYCTEVEALPNEAEARAFMANYASVIARTGWKVFI